MKNERENGGSVKPIDFPNNTQEIFNINKIRQNAEQEIETKMELKKIANGNLTAEELRKEVLDEMNTSKSYDSIDSIKDGPEADQLDFSEFAGTIDEKQPEKNLSSGKNKDRSI